MKNALPTLTSVLGLSIFLTVSQLVFAQDNADPSFAQLNFYHPRGKSSEGFGLFLNRKYVAPIPFGGRLTYRLMTEGSLMITVMAGSNYVEPRTLAKNTRTIPIKKGKVYY